MARKSILSGRGLVECVDKLRLRASLRAKRQIVYEVFHEAHLPPNKELVPIIGGQMGKERGNGDALCLLQVGCHVVAG